MAYKDKDLYVKWRKWLIDIEQSEADVAKIFKIAPNNLNRSIRNGAIRYTLLRDILAYYGYSVDWTKKP